MVNGFPAITIDILVFACSYSSADPIGTIVAKAKTAKTRTPKYQTRLCFLLVESNVDSPFWGRVSKLGEGMANRNFGQISFVGLFRINSHSADSLESEAGVSVTLEWDFAWQWFNNRPLAVIPVPEAGVVDP